MRFFLLLASLVVAGCGGHGASAPCGDRADCPGDLDCAGPNDPQVCGIPPREECTNDSACDMTARCHAIADPCSPDGIGSECRPPCTTDDECGTSFRCAMGACVAVLCNAGFTCAPREVCDPARITAITPIFDRNHGCFAITCSDDAACGQRFCVNGSCQDGPGMCRRATAAP